MSKEGSDILQAMREVDAVSASAEFAGNKRGNARCRSVEVTLKDGGVRTLTSRKRPKMGQKATPATLAYLLARAGIDSYRPAAPRAMTGNLIVDVETRTVSISWLGAKKAKRLKELAETAGEATQ